MKNRLLIIVTGVMLIVVSTLSNFSSNVHYIAFSIGVVLLGSITLDLYFLYRENKNRGNKKRK